jgi:hypothetical protein
LESWPCSLAGALGGHMLRLRTWAGWVVVVTASLIGLGALAGLRASRLLGSAFADADLGGDAASVAGRWSAQLRIGRRTLFIPGVGTIIRAELRLSPQPYRDSLGTQVSCPGCLTGTLSGDFRPLGDGYPPRLDVEAHALRDGRVLLVAGGCCDRGELSLHLRSRGDRLVGSWRQVFVVSKVIGSASLERDDTR